jgi:hypothetical protein
MKATARVIAALAVPFVLASCDALEELFGLDDPAADCQSSPIGCPGSTGNDFSNPFNPVIAGVPLFCTSPATQQYVAFVPNPTLNDIGRSRFGFPPTIELNPNGLARLPAKIQLFWYGHECAHHVLGHTVGNYNSFTSESEADCWSIRVGIAQGLFTRQQVTAFEPYFRNLTGSSSGHLPGPQRAALLVQCASS